MAALAHHAEGVDPGHLQRQRARLGPVVALSPVEEGMTDRDLAVIDVVLLAMIEVAGVRARLVYFTFLGRVTIKDIRRARGFLHLAG